MEAWRVRNPVYLVIVICRIWVGNKTIKIQPEAWQMRDPAYQLYDICEDKSVTYIIYVFYRHYIFKSSITNFPQFLSNLIVEIGIHIIILFIDINIGWISILYYTFFFSMYSVVLDVLLCKSRNYFINLQLISQNSSNRDINIRSLKRN